MFATSFFFNVTNFYLTTSVIWSCTYFYLFFYIALIFSVVIYLVSTVNEFLNFSTYKNLSNSTFVSGFNMFKLLVTPILLLLLLNFSWSGAEVLAWFGHVIFTSFQFKVSYLIFWSYLFVCVVYSSIFYYTSQEVYDFSIVTYSFFCWIVFLFTANNAFTLIFLIEVLSTLITLLLITSVFSSAYFYNNLNFSNTLYFDNLLPTAFLQTLLFFFWISLVSSLNLFVFLILFYLTFLTFDWFLLDAIVYYVVTLGDVKKVFTVSAIWFNFMFCLFIKCGLVPFFFWKPTFFKGITLATLFMYICFYYYFLLLFFSYFLVIYMNELFFFNTAINYLFLLSGTLILVFILCESYYIKAFLALSSILNTLFVFLALSAFPVTDCYFLF